MAGWRSYVSFSGHAQGLMAIEPVAASRGPRAWRIWLGLSAAGRKLFTAVSWLSQAAPADFLLLRSLGHVSLHCCFELPRILAPRANLVVYRSHFVTEFESVVLSEGSPDTDLPDV